MLELKWTKPLLKEAKMCIREKLYWIELNRIEA